MNTQFQIIFPCSETDVNEIHPRYQSDAKVMSDMGITVGTIPLAESTELMYRGFIVNVKDKFPNDARYLNTYEIYTRYQYLSDYYPCISDLSIETFFVDDLNESVYKLIEEKRWDKVFIKKDSKALEHIEEGKSVWPQTSFDEMLTLYNEYPFEGKFAIRKFIDKETIDKEERYWVFNGNIYHRHKDIPEVVKKAAKRLNTLGSRYYTIDATPEFVVEVNPGESSDRHAVNSAELFASWIKKEFDN